MSVRTHDSSWRMLVGAAPLVGVAFVVLALTQGEGDVARSPAVRGILALVGAVGGLVAWWTARQLRAAPSLPVARACELAQSGQLAGAVTLSGRAAPLPGASPLVSPGGELCLWFHHGRHDLHHYSASDSLSPFLLVDDSGQCIVLPAGADISGSSRPRSDAVRPPEGLAANMEEWLSIGKTDIDGRQDFQPAFERLLREGDRIRIVGRLLPASPEAMSLQARAASLAARSGTATASAGAGEPEGLDGGGRPSFSRPPPQASAAALALPVIGAPGGTEPFIVSIGGGEGEGDFYGLLAVLDGIVMLVAGGLFAWAVVAQP